MSPAESHRPNYYLFQTQQPRPFFNAVAFRQFRAQPVYRRSQRCGYRFGAKSRGEVSLHGDERQTLSTPDNRIIHAPDWRGKGAEGNLFTVIPLNSQRREGGKVKTLIVPARSTTSTRRSLSRTDVTILPDQTVLSIRARLSDDTPAARAAV